MSDFAQQRFVRAEAELAEVCSAAKSRACPHCRRLGTINAHGFLRGYSESGKPGVTRGRRFFCSNRRRPGCGRTFSILIQSFVKRFVVTAVTLAVFVVAVLAGASIASAWYQAAAQRFSRSSGFRLWRRVVHAQHHWRSLLVRRGPPPDSQAEQPLTQLIEHMRLHVKADGNQLLAAFQFEFQRGLFE